MKLSMDYQTKDNLEINLQFNIASNNLCIFKCNLFDFYQENGCKVFDVLSMKAKLTQLISRHSELFELFEEVDINRSASATLFFTKQAMIFNASAYPNVRSISTQCIFPLTHDELIQFKTEIQRIIDLL